jgi:hypothetical protein
MEGELLSFRAVGQVFGDTRPLGIPTKANETDCFQSALYGSEGLGEARIPASHRHQH